MQRPSIYIQATWLACILLALVATPAMAGGQSGFSNASLKGKFASTSIGRGGDLPVAGMSVIIADGKGNFYGKSVVNRPFGEFGERIVVEFPVKGTYHIARDGTGTVEFAPPENIGEVQHAHILITQAQTGKHRKHRVATEVALILDELTPRARTLQTTVLKRLPGHSNFSNSSLKGTYTTMGIGRGGIAPVAGMTRITADGKGNFVGKTVINRPNGEYGERQIVSFPIRGWYHVDKNGMGTLEIVVPPELGEPQHGHFIITEAHARRRHKSDLATGLSFVLDELLPNAAALQTANLKRRP